MGATSRTTDRRLRPNTEAGEPGPAASDGKSRENGLPGIGEIRGRLRPAARLAAFHRSAQFVD